MTTFSPSASKLAIIPVDRENLLNAIIRFEKSHGQSSHQCLLSLKDTCTRCLLLLLGHEHEIYQIYLSPRLIRYVTYDYLTQTNNTQYPLTNDDQLFSDVKILCCRDCSLNNLGASKCRRRKCFANRVRKILNELSCQIIPWPKQQYFGILENIDDDDNPVVFIYLKTNNCGYSKHKNQNWIEGLFYLLDLLRILHMNMFRE